MKSKAHHLGINSINNFLTGNYIQYTVITYNGEESEKEYIGLTESLCCIPETNTVSQIYFNCKKKCVYTEKLSARSMYL